MSKPGAKLKVLILCNYAYPAGCVRDHIDAIVNDSGHDCTLFDPTLDTKVLYSPERFDLLVIHYSLWVESPLVITPPWREAIRAYEGPKVQFLHDEYRNVAKIKHNIRDLGIDCLMTVVPESKLEAFYGDLEGVRLESILTGYVPPRMTGRSRPPMHSRKIDVGYRGRTYAYTLGRLANEKAVIGRLFRQQAEQRGANLKCDISSAEEDRIYGDKWDEFLKNSRAVLGTESGASVIDWDGSVGEQVQRYIELHPQADFEEVAEQVLQPYDGKLVLNTIAPKHFEAAALGTLQVQFPGEYSGIMNAWEHYVPLQRDFSNFDEVVEVILDDDKAQSIAERAYRDLIASGRFSYQTFGRSCGRIFSEMFAQSPESFRCAGRSHYTASQLKLLKLRSLRLKTKMLGFLGRRTPAVYGLMWKTKIAAYRMREHSVSALCYSAILPRLVADLLRHASSELRHFSKESFSRAVTTQPGCRLPINQLLTDLRWLLFVDTCVRGRVVGAAVDIRETAAENGNCRKARIELRLPAVRATDGAAIGAAGCAPAEWTQLLAALRKGEVELEKITVRSEAEIPARLTEQIRGQYVCDQAFEAPHRVAVREFAAKPVLSG